MFDKNEHLHHKASDLNIGSNKVLLSPSWRQKPSPSLASSFLLSNTAKGRWPSDVKYSCTDSRAGPFGQDGVGVMFPSHHHQQHQHGNQNNLQNLHSHFEHVLMTMNYDEDANYWQQVYRLYLVGGEGSRVKRVTGCEGINTDHYPHPRITCCIIFTISNSCKCVTANAFFIHRTSAIITFLGQTSSYLELAFPWVFPTREGGDLL